MTKWPAFQHASFICYRSGARRGFYEHAAFARLERVRERFLCERPRRGLPIAPAHP